MKIKKSFLSVCLSISLMFGCFVPSISAYASSGDSDNQNFIQRNWNKVVSDTAGFLSDSVQYTKDFLQWLTGHKSDYGIGEDEDPDDWVTNNTTFDPTTGNITISDNVINSMRDMINNYVNNDAGFKYVYSTQTSSYVTQFNDQDNYHAFLDFISSYEDSSSICYIPDGYIGYRIYLFTPPDNQKFDFVYYSGPSYGAYTCDFYSNWVLGAGKMEIFDYDSNSKSYIKSSTSNNISGHIVKLKSNPSQISYGSCPIRLNTTQYIMYMTREGMQISQEGIQEYYVSDSYNTSHISGSYNTTLTDINNAPTYTDVNSYINQYYTTNNNYPTTTQIYNYINNYEGSSGGDSGSDDDDDGEGIWALIQKVLDFISKLFDTVAGFLADLVDSLGDVVNSVIDNILNIITSFKDNIPNAIGELLEWFFPFLPSEIVSLIELSILCAVIVGLVRLIRGH